MGMFRWTAPLFARWGDRWPREDADAIADLLRPYVPEGGRLLDLGGGTGALAARMADTLSCRVTVLDPAPEMVSYVPDRDDVDAVIGSAEDMPFESSRFDAVLVSDAFHHFRDRDGAASEMARVVKCGGGVLLLELDPRGPAMRALALVERILGEPGAFFAPHDMCAFMSERGVDGRCQAMRGASYYFLGTVRQRDT